MAKPFSAAYQAALVAGCQFAACIQLVLRDSKVVAFTTWSDYLTVSGVSYDPNNLVTFEAVSAQTGTAVMTVKVNGILGSYNSALGRVITADDVRFYFNGATMLAFMTIPTLLTGSYVFADVTETINFGDVGNVEIISDSEFTFEFRSTMQRAAIQYGRFITETCHRRFGVAADGCPVDITLYEHTATVASISADKLTMTFTVTPSRTFTKGKIRATTGTNAVVPDIPIKTYTQTGPTATVLLSDSFPYLVSVGDSMILTEGCRKDMADCSFYGALWAFGGFPDVPGADRLAAAGS